jgi:ABC-type polysaccharide/polyol phosphate export permease
MHKAASFVCAVLAVVFCGLVAASADDTHANWASVFVPMYLMDPVLLLATIHSSKKKWAYFVRPLLLIVAKIIFEALLVSKLQGNISSSYIAICTPLLIFLAVLSEMLIRHVKKTV